MTYTVGQQILNGQLVVVTVDTAGLILSASTPIVHDISGNPFTLTYNAGVTETAIKAALEKVTG